MSDVMRLLAQPTSVRVRGVIGTARTPRGFWKQSKFWITNDYVLVYVEENGKPTLADSKEIIGFESPHRADAPDGVSRPATRHYAVETADGETWELTPTGHCACGSSLRYFDPFPPPNRSGT